MSGMKPKFLEGAVLPHSYYAEPDPYTNPESTKVNLREMSRYAKTKGKTISELTLEEVKRFRT